MSSKKSVWHTLCSIAALASVVIAAAATNQGCSSSAPSLVPELPNIDASTGTPPTTGTTCAAPRTTCNGACVDTQSDVANCGACGKACKEGEVCSKGACAPSCTAGTTQCGTACIDLSSDPKNCGACAKACASGEVCSSGTCSLTCGGGTVKCGSACVNTNIDNGNCGACGNNCGPGRVCSNGACSTTCTPGLNLCTIGGSTTDGGTGEGGAASDAGSGASTVCADFKTSRQHCGACNAPCANGFVCANGTCQINCPNGLIACNGSCVNPLTDRNYCGASLGCGVEAGSTGTVCAGGNVCNNGSCQISCATGQVNCNGTCVDPLTNGTYCGASGACGNGGGSAGTTCSSGNVCNGGTCSLTCQQGLVNCNGTCVDPLTNRDFCGASGACGNGGGSAGTACSAGNVCNNGTCGLSCQQGLVNCNGTCVDPLTNRNFCGASGACGNGGGSAGTSCGNGSVCSNGSCTLSCQPGLINCGGTCVDPLTSRNFCGATGACGNGGGSAGATCAAGNVCNNGTCQVSCPAGQINCGGTCVNPLTNRSFCGASGACGNGGGSAGTTCAAGNVCSNGTCQVSCPVGQINCGGTCVNPLTDRNFCGASGACGNGGGSIGTACQAGNVCNNGTCQLSCPAGQINCNGACVDPLTDRNFCGATGACGNGGGSAGTACSVGSVCSSGSCSSTCGSPLTNCNNSCVDTRFDPGNCGGCGTTCPARSNASSVCASSSCSFACNSGFANCNGNANDGCEINTTNNASNCGSCGNACTYANGTGVCASGTCSLAACTPGFINCNGIANDGCEINVTTDLNNCGLCGRVCNIANATAGCSSGTCIIASCNAGFANCNNNAGDGCEINTTNNANNCGSCGNVCTIANGTAGCSGSACTVAACNAGFANCNNNASDGCEINTTNNASNCGSCGNVCSVANGTAGCSGSSCTVASCNAGFGNCDNNPSNGCEVNTNTDNNNCGTCGNVCGGGSTCVNGTCQSGGTLIFDSIPGGITGSTTRGAGDSCGTLVNVSQTHTITNIAVRADPVGGGNIRFVVMNHATHTVLLYTTAKAFVDNGAAWYKSDALSIQLVAGQSYDIGALTDVGASWSYDTSGNSANGITSVSSNPNFSNYASPSQVGHAGADCGIQLFE